MALERGALQHGVRGSFHSESLNQPLWRSRTWSMVPSNSVPCLKSQAWDHASFTKHFESHQIFI